MQRRGGDMMNKQLLTISDINYHVTTLCESIIANITTLIVAGTVYVYGVPRGGIPVAYAMVETFNRIVQKLGNSKLKFQVSGLPEHSGLIVDDIIDSGSTRNHYVNNYNPRFGFHALINKIVTPSDKWYVFPWEVSTKTDTSVHDSVVRLLQYIGEDVDREGLSGTPERVIKAWGEWSKGYTINLDDLFTTFKDGSENYDQMVVIKDIPFYSHCEHHLAPFFGTATVAYIPNGKIIGLSKIARVVEAYSKRLQVQERLTQQVATLLHSKLDALGVGVCIKARHLCMESRGICQQGHFTVTSALRGVFIEDAACRAEFFSMVK